MNKFDGGRVGRCLTDEMQGRFGARRVVVRPVGFGCRYLYGFVVVMFCFFATFSRLTPANVVGWLTHRL